MKFKAKTQQLKNEVLKSGLTADELLKKSGVSSKTMAKVTNGGSVIASTANKIATALGVPVTDLFE